MKVSGHFHAQSSRARGTYRTGSWQGPRYAMDMVDKTKVSAPARNPASSLVLIVTELFMLGAKNKGVSK
jgi:hypothetical protein